MSRILPVIEAIRGEGTTSLHRIAEELNRRGILTARGGQWPPRSRISSIARRADRPRADQMAKRSPI